jgi:hypothetical protein
MARVWREVCNIRDVLRSYVERTYLSTRNTGKDTQHSMQSYVAATCTSVRVLLDTMSSGAHARHTRRTIHLANRACQVSSQNSASPLTLSLTHRTRHLPRYRPHGCLMAGCRCRFDSVEQLRAHLATHARRTNGDMSTGNGSGVQNGSAAAAAAKRARIAIMPPGMVHGLVRSHMHRCGTRRA